MSTKVFVGNLSFKITSEQLRDEFSTAGNVLSANIISRGPRSLGYGFVEFASREDAEKSVSVLNHKEIDGREINVEVAKPRADLPEREKRQDGQDGQVQGQSQQGQRPPRRPRKPRNNNAGNTTTTTTTTPSNQPQGAPGPRRGPQQGGAPRRMYKPRYQNQDNTGVEGQQQGNHAPRNFNNNFNANQNNFSNNVDGQQGPRFRRRRPRNQHRGPAAQDQQVPQQPQQPQQQPQFRRKRPAAQPRKQQERISSPTTLFVANLPFSVDDKELAEIFSSKWKVVKAHVVTKRNTRSKGFGFVEFENETDQQAALKEFDGFTLHERVLNVKVALTSLPGAEDDAAAGAEKPAEGAEKTQPAEEKGAAAAAGDAPAAAAEPKTETKAAEAPAAAATEGGAAEEKKDGQ